MNQLACVMPAHNWLTESDLAFDATDADQSHVHPLIGLAKFGAFSHTMIAQVFDPLRIGFIVAHGQTGLARRLLAELEQRFQPAERRSYLVEYPVFHDYSEFASGPHRRGVMSSWTSPGYSNR